MSIAHSMTTGNIATTGAFPRNWLVQASSTMMANLKQMRKASRYEISNGLSWQRTCTDINVPTTGDSKHQQFFVRWPSDLLLWIKTIFRERMQNSISGVNCAPAWISIG
jgi:hypothetical protein